MRNRNLLLVFLFSIYQLSAHAAKNSSTTNSASATVVAPVTLVKTADLLFGSVAPAAFASGTVTVYPTGGRIGSNVVLSLTNSGNPASFYLTGNPGAGFSIDLPNSIIG